MSTNKSRLIVLTEVSRFRARMGILVRSPPSKMRIISSRLSSVLTVVHPHSSVVCLDYKAQTVHDLDCLKKFFEKFFYAF
ncbi:MAG: hypothetical protein LBM93_10385 [Oscillospiraceae bacterium]|nr:hypothetical protein [Oscillospiraceae bacterium]